MTLIITVTHILVSLALIFVVLLQKGSGADMGAAFGGSSQSVFGARGSGSFLGKMTAGLATVFMITSLSLAFFTTQKSANISVMEKAPITENAKPNAVEEPKGPPVPAKGSIKPIEPAANSVIPKPEGGIQSIPALPVTQAGQEGDIPSVPKSSQ